MPEGVGPAGVVGHTNSWCSSRKPPQRRETELTVAAAASSSSALTSRPRAMQALEAASTESCASPPPIRANVPARTARSTDQVVSRQSRRRCSSSGGQRVHDLVAHLLEHPEHVLDRGSYVWVHGRPERRARAARHPQRGHRALERSGERLRRVGEVVAVPRGGAADRVEQGGGVADRAGEGELVSESADGLPHRRAHRHAAPRGLQPDKSAPGRRECGSIRRRRCRGPSAARRPRPAPPCRRSSRPDCASGPTG